MTDTPATVSFDSPAQAQKDGGGTPDANRVAMWIAAWDAATKEEKDWRKLADEAVKIYRGGGGDKDADVDSQTWFNVLHSNTETILPAIYNSTPIPDIRRRFNDPGDAEKAASDILERALSYSIDQYDFDGTIRNVLFDAYLPGRGLLRVRYLPYFSKAPEGPPPEGEDEQADEETEVAYEEVKCEYVPWKQFRRGPGRTWEDVTWCGFELFLSRDQLLKLCGKALGQKIQLDCTASSKDDENKSKERASPDSEDIFGRARVYEIWDKTKRQALFIAPGYGAAPIKETDDPLGLTDFFPVPRPLQPLLTPGDLTPVVPYSVYKKLAEELNDIQRRAKRLIKQLRVRGIYAGPTNSMEGVLEADDGQLVPVPGLEAFINGGGLDKAIAWWPLDPTVKALQVISERFTVVQSLLFQVAGIADIMRGEGDPNATATQENIKNQWGSLRVQRMQADVQRMVRDLFRMKAELLAEKFSMQNLMLMTGVKLVPAALKQQAQQMQQQMQQQAQMAAQQQPPGQPGQPPQQPPQPPQLPPEIKDALELPTIEEVQQILRSNLVRSYKIDIESDSTIRADLTRDKGEMAQFMDGVGKFMQGAIPAAQAEPALKPVLITMLGAFGRLFRLGKQSEDAMDKAERAAMAEAENPPPPPPNPDIIKAQAAQAKAQSDVQLNVQKMQLEQQKHQQDMEIEAQKLEFERQKVILEGQIKQQEAEQKLAMQAEEAKRKAEMDMQTHAMDLQAQQAKGQADMEMQAQLNQQKLAMTQSSDAAKFQDERTRAQFEHQHIGEMNKIKLSAAKTKAAQAGKPKQIAFKRGKEGRIDGAEIN